jgi:hypothetical protein
MSRPLNRPTLKTPAHAMQTFQVVAPKSTHTRRVSCEDVQCPQYARGWKMTIDLNTKLGREQAMYIKYDAGRSYKITAQRDGLVELEFAANQPCFQEHRVRNDLPEIFRVKGGDHRGNPLRTPVRTHKKPEFWVEEFAENQDRLKTAIERG